MSVISDWSRQEFIGNPLSDYLLFFLILFAVYASFAFFMRLLRSRLVKKIADDRSRLFERIIGFTRRPFRLLMVTFAFWLGVRIFNLPEIAKAVVQNVFIALLAVTVCYVLLRVVDAVAEFFRPKVAKTESKLDDHLLPIINSTLKAFIIIVAILLVIQNWGYNITSLLAGLGLGGLAVALAAQDTLTNVFGAVAIFVDQPFHVGDLVALEGFTGSIESIGVRSTRLRTFDGTLVTFPNSIVAKAKIDNLTARPTRRTVFTIGVTYDTGYDKLQKAVQILREVMTEHAGTAQCRAYFNSYGDFSLNILAQHWCKYLDYEMYLQCLEEINFEIMKRFEEAQIEFAFPTQTLYLKSESQEKDG